MREGGTPGIYGIGKAVREFQPRPGWERACVFLDYLPAAVRASSWREGSGMRVKRALNACGGGFAGRL